MKNKRDNYFVCVEKLENIFRPLLLYYYITEFDLLSNCNISRVRQWKSSCLPFRGQFCRISISIICSFFLLCFFGLLFAYFVHSIFFKTKYQPSFIVLRYCSFAQFLLLLVSLSMSVLLLKFINNVIDAYIFISNTDSDIIYWICCAQVNLLYKF